MDLVLHIGTEKTGTTLIQQWIRANRSVLAAQGVAVSDVLGNRLLAARLQSRLDDLHARLGLADTNARDRYFHDFDARFSAELDRMRQQGAHSLLVSSEHLSSRMTNREDLTRLRAWLEPQFRRITVVAYLREQADLNRSLYSTAILNGQTCSLAEFSDRISEGDVYYNFDLMLGLWADVLAPDRMVVAVYDHRAFVGGDLRRDFLSRALPGLSDTGMTFAGSRANPGITTGQAAVMARINRLGLPQLPRRVICELVRYLPLRDDPAPLARRVAVYGLFDASNRAVAQRHLGHADNPFPAPDVQVLSE